MAALKDARQRTLALVSDLNEEQLRVPLLPIINPIVWEIGHVGWFQEKWVLRHTRGQPALMSDADSLWDSAAVGRYALDSAAAFDCRHPRLSGERAGTGG